MSFFGYLSFAQPRVVQREPITLIRQDRGPQVAITADVHEGLAVLAGVLDQRSPEHGLEAEQW